VRYFLFVKPGRRRTRVESVAAESPPNIRAKKFESDSKSLLLDNDLIRQHLLEFGVEGRLGLPSPPSSDNRVRTLCPRHDTAC